MAKKNKNQDAAAVSAPALTLLTILGALATLWAFFLWKELVDVRMSGKEPFCAFGESDCGLLWDAAFASTIHRYTGLPVAAWGAVWGLVALLMPVLARKAQSGNTARRFNAVKWTAVAGLVGLVVLLGISAFEGLFCTSCAVTYVLTLAYGGVVFFVLQPRLPLSTKGVEMAAGATLVAFLVLLYPGLSTPKSQARKDQQLLDEAARRQAAQDSVATSNSPTSETSEAATAKLDGQLKEFLDAAQPELLQALSNSLDLFRHARYHEEDPRFLQGSYTSKLRVTEFTDALCPHCGTLHFALEQIRGLVPEGSFSVDARHYPLDGNCNSGVPVRGPETVRCDAARAQICMEGSPEAAKFSGEVFKNQRGLTLDKLYTLARPYSSRSALRGCMDSEETRTKLADDVAYAAHFDLKGTPLVLINGKELKSQALTPVLYALIMAGGSPDHPLFADLPAPEMQSTDEHAGHGH